MRTPDALLLDTHIWVWLVKGDQRLVGHKALQKAVEELADRESLWVSAFSVWEIAMLDSKGRIDLGRRCEAWVKEALDASRVQLAPLDPATSITSTRLEGFEYGDPADRIIAATAIENGWPLVTADKRLAGYLKGRKMRVWEIE